MVDIVNPTSAGNAARKKRGVHVVEKALEENAGELLRASAPRHRRAVRVDGLSVSTANPEQARGEVLDKKKRQLRRREVVLERRVNDAGEGDGIEEFLDVPERGSRTHSDNRRGFIKE